MSRAKNKRNKNNKNNKTLSTATNTTDPTTHTTPTDSTPYVPQNPDPLELIEQVQQTANDLAQLQDQSNTQNIQDTIERRFSQLERLITDIATRQDKLSTNQTQLHSKQEKINEQNTQLAQELESSKHNQNLITHQNQDIKTQESLLDNVQTELNKKQAELQDEINKLIKDQSLSDAKKESFSNHIKNQRKEIQELHEKIDTDSGKLKTEQHKLQELTETLDKKQAQNQKQNARFHEVFHTLTLHQRQIVGQQDLIENQQKQIDSAKTTLKKQRERLSKEERAKQIIPEADTDILEKYNELETKYLELQDNYEKHLLDNSRSDFNELDQERIHEQEAQLTQLKEQVIKLSHMHKHDLEIILTLEQDLAHQHKQIKMLEVTPVPPTEELVELQKQKDKFQRRKKRLAKAKKLLDAQVIKTRKQRLASKNQIQTPLPINIPQPTTSHTNTNSDQQNIEKQKEMLTQVQSFLQDTEVQMRSRWATSNAISTITSIIITVGLIALLSIFVVDQTIPNIWQSKIILRLAPKNSTQAADPQWLNAQKEIIYSETSLDQTLNHLNSKGHNYFQSNADLRAFYHKSLTLSSPTPGALKLKTTDLDQNKLNNILKAVATSRLTYKNETEIQKRPRSKTSRFITIISHTAPNRTK